MVESETIIKTRKDAFLDAGRRIANQIHTGETVPCLCHEEDAAMIASGLTRAYNHGIELGLGRACQLAVYAMQEPMTREAYRAVDDLRRAIGKDRTLDIPEQEPSP